MLVFDNTLFNKATKSGCFIFTVTYDKHALLTQDMPEKDSGEVFGLNRNTEILYQTAETKKLSDALQLLQPHGFARVRPDNAATLTSICSILQKARYFNCSINMLHEKFSRILAGQY